MVAKIPLEVERYINHFQSEHEKILHLKHQLHRKLLTVSMLSALAEGRYPNVSGDKAKFVKLIEEYSCWTHTKHVSISQLRMMLHKNRKISQSFRAAVSLDYQGRHRRRNPSVTLELDSDPRIEVLISLCGTDADRAVLNSAKHSSLLYTYRCKLVHEFREPGNGLEVFQGHSPYYHAFELVYPTKWFVGLVPPILTSLQDYYVTTQTNPYESYRFGSPWTQ
jgi:hypothetical protein